MNALSLWEATLSLRLCYEVNTQWFVEYIGLPAMSPKFLKFLKFLKLLSLQCRIVEPNIVVYTWSMREWKYVQCSRLDYILSNKFICSSLIWLVEPSIMYFSCLYNNWCSLPFIYFLFISHIRCILFTKGKTPQCCQSLPVSCWRHCIKEFKIEHDVWRVIHDVRSYCLEGGEDPCLLDLDIFMCIFLMV